MRRYKLDGRVPVPADDLLEWAKWYETADRTVSKTERPGYTVSTVFLGLDHRYLGDGPPLLFETMIFGGNHDQYQSRCSTWEEAEAMHAKAVEMAESGQQ